MSRKPDTFVPPIDSASVLIIRDGDEHSRHGSLQILMVKRHQNIRFAGGAYVFPGGKLDEADRVLEDKGHEIPKDFCGFRYTALREVFEETGLIIGTRDGAAIDEDLRQTLAREFRPAFLKKDITIAEFIAHSGVEFDLKYCRPFAHWITPIIYPVRYNTRFFLCVAPAGQVPSPDGHEITHLLWIHPMTLVEESTGVLMFPTMMNLKRLGQAKSVSEALEILRKREIVTVIPEVILGDKRSFRKIPDAAGYDDVDQSRTRTALNLDNG